MRFTGFQALSFDCYGTLINWEAGIAAVLSPWAKRRGLTLDDEQLLTAYPTQEATADSEHPTNPDPGILTRSLRVLGDQRPNSPPPSKPSNPAPPAAQATISPPPIQAPRDPARPQGYQLSTRSG